MTKTKTSVLEVYKDKKGMYKFRLLSRDGAVIVESKGYDKKASCVTHAKKLAEWTAKSTLVDADKKADAASKTTGKRSLKQTAVRKAETSKAQSSATTKLRK